MEVLRAGILKFAIAILFALVADAAEAGGQVGQAFFDNGGQSAITDEIGFFTLDAPAVGAALMVEIRHSDKPMDKLAVGFFDKNAWAKFATIWRKARRAKRPTEAEVYKNAADVGSYYDVDDKTLVTVSLDTDGNIVFLLAGEPDANKKPTMLEYFRLTPRDFKGFDRDVALVSAYFAK